MPDYFLRTPRLGFREWSINDLSLALDLWGDPGVSRFLGGPYSREGIEVKLNKEIAALNVHQSILSHLSAGQQLSRWVRRATFVQSARTKLCSGVPPPPSVLG